MKLNKKFFLTKPQKHFVYAREKYPAIIAGLGAGKSRAAALRLITLLATDPGINVAYYMPTYDLLNLRAIPQVEEDLIALGLSYTLNRSEYTIHVHHLGKIIFRSLTRPERIVAYEVAHSIVDEIDTLPLDKAEVVWRKVTERNRQRSRLPNSIGAVTTPDQGFNGLAYKKWGGEVLQPGYRLIRAATTSNPYLPKDYVESIRANYDPMLAEMYIQGYFVNLNQNKVYNYFDRQQNHSDRVLLEDDIVYCGVDFNVGGCCVTEWVFDGPKPVAVGEFVAHDTQAIVSELQIRHEERKVYLYPDASGDNRHTNAAETDIDLLEQSGFAVDAPDANPAIRDRINTCNAHFSHDRMAVNTRECPKLTEALEQQAYNDKGEPEKYNTHPALDDWVDSMGYFIHRRMPITKPVAAPRMGR